MRLDKVNVDMYISQNSQEDQSQEDPQPQESDSIVQIDLNLDEEETPKPDENRIQIPMGDLEDSLDEGKISIPLAGQASEEDNTGDNFFRIPTDKGDTSSTEDVSKERKRDEKFRAKQGSITPGSRQRSETFGEESRIEHVVIEDSIRKYYKLEVQKVTLKVNLPTHEDQPDNKILKGQTIFMFNRKVDEEDSKDATRKLGLDFNSKYLTITKISTAKRHRKRDENNKVIDTYHERKKDLEFNYGEANFEKLTSKFSQDQGGEQQEDPFQSRP